MFYYKKKTREPPRKEKEVGQGIEVAQRVVLTPGVLKVLCMATLLKYV
jgi:hypothetical protein